MWQASLLPTEPLLPLFKSFLFQNQAYRADVKGRSEEGQAYSADVRGGKK